MFKFFILSISIVIYLPLSAQMISAEWSRFQDLSNNGAVGEYPFVLCDSSENVIVCGGTYNPGPLIGLVVTKYNASGVFQWESKFDTNAQDIVKSGIVDAAGNVYVVVNTKDVFTNASRFVLFKYDGSTGALLWEYRYQPGLPGVSNTASKLLLLPNQQVILVGNSKNTNTQISSPLTVCLTPAGDIVWNHLYDNNPSGSGAFTAELIDGKIVVWGRGTVAAGTFGFLCVVLDQEGMLQSDYLSQPYTDIFSSGYHIDKQGNLYIGDFEGDYKTLKYNLKGELEWIYSKPTVTPPYLGFVGARVWSIQTDTNLNVYIGGTYYADSITWVRQYVTMVDKDGNLMWEHNFFLDSLYKGVQSYRATLTDNGFVVFAGGHPTGDGTAFYEPYLAYYNSNGYVSGGICDVDGNKNGVNHLSSNTNHIYLTGISTPDVFLVGSEKQYVSKIAVPIVSSTHTSSSTLLPLEIFPNPGHGAISATFDYQGKQRSGVVDVVNTEGRVISSQLFLAEQGKNQVALRCAEVLPAGIYSVVLRLGTDIYSGKLIKN